ncbi:MAG: hypothetical protein NT013_20590 [Planctomycetia bacterium]|nr:hypothetical protein [Planctomycetia bacterium]
MKSESSNLQSANSLSIGAQRLLLGLLLCCGGTIVWTALLGWVGEWATTWLNRGQTSESRSVHLQTNGELCVAVQHYGRNPYESSSVEYQTLDGQPIVLEPDELTRARNSWSTSSFPLNYYNLRHAPNAYNLWIDAPEPLPWSLRLPQFAEGDWSTAHRREWFFRWPRRAGGSGYFEGFDLQTKRRIGFIGMNGFSETAPPAADQFPAWDSNKSATAAFAAHGGIYTLPQSVAAMLLNEPGESPEFGLWLITPKRDRMFVINLTRRSIVATRVLTGKLLGTGKRDQTTDNSQSYRSVQHANPTLALLWADRLEVVSPTLQTLREIRFPKELHGKVSSLTELPSGEFEESYADRSPNPLKIPAEQHFVRFNDRGEVTLRKTVTVPLPKASPYWFAEQYLMPLSLTPIYAVSWVTPSFSGYFYDLDGNPLRQPDEPMTWSLRLKAFQIGMSSLGWNGSFWLTVISGLPFAGLCAWRQRTLPTSRFDRIAWPLLLCLFGVVGWVAFLTHRRWPVSRVAVSNSPMTELAAA